jgi:multiple sugar transport system substrate-binding protein
MVKLNRRTFLKYSAGATGAAFGGVVPAFSQDTQDAKRVLRVAWWGGNTRHAKMNAIMDAYEVKYPETNIGREPAPWPSYWERTPTQFAGGNAPDLLWFTERQISDYAASDRLMELKDLQSHGLDLSAFRPEDLENRAIQGKQLRLPIGDTVPSTMWNTKMFEEAGIEGPDGTWSWDDFHQTSIDIAKALGKGRYGTTLLSVDASMFQTFLFQEGKSVFAPDGSASLNFDATDVERWFTVWKELQDAGGCVPADIMSESQSSPNEDKPFPKGLCAINFQNSNQLVIHTAALRANQGEDASIRLNMFPLLGSKPAALVLGTDFAVNAATKYPEEAARVLNFFFNDPEANHILGMEMGVPPNQKWLEAIKPTLPPTEKYLAEYHQSIADITQPAPVNPKGGQRINTLMPEIGYAVAFDQLSPADAAGRLVDDLAAAIGAK